MANFVIRRILGLGLSLWAAVTLTFWALHFAPGDPAEAVLSQSSVPRDVIEQRREALGLHLPLIVQYTRYLSSLLCGDLGLSWSGGQPVGFLIGQQVGATISLAVGGMAVAVTLGFFLGLSAAVGRSRVLASASRGIVGFMLSIPVMFSGTLLVWLFSVQLGWLPATGQGDLKHLLLPALVVGCSVSAGIARAVDAGVSETLCQPFVRAALAKGCSWRRVLWRHVLRVGLLPTIDIVALQSGYLLGGTVVAESVFVRQGLGRLLVNAVLSQDLPVVRGVVALTAISYGLLNLLADIAHVVLDPRVRLDK